MNPTLYSINNEYYGRVYESGSGCVSTGYPPDPLYPSDPRSDCLALTPVYRNNQQGWFNIIDAWPSHGPTDSGNNCNGIWHSYDGTPFPAYSPDTLSVAEKEQYRKDWYQFIFPNFPNDFSMRGTKDLYDTMQPFADPTKPKPSEIELWNNAVLNLFREMSALPPATMSQELFIMCCWTRERKTTTMWDTKYPGPGNSSYGPCQGANNVLHCGTTFKPSDIEDQKPYWNDYYCGYPCVESHPLSTLEQGSEAITVWYNGNAFGAFPRNLRKLFEGSGTTGAAISGHAGPYAGRSLYGLIVGRSKWAGSSFTPPPGYSF